MQSATTSNNLAWGKMANMLFTGIALVFIAIEGKPIFCPMMLALLFAFILLPVASHMEKHFKFHRILAASVSVILLTTLCTAIFYFAFNQLNDITGNLPLLEHQFTSALEKIQTWASQVFHIEPKEQKTFLNNAVSKITSTNGSMIGQTMSSLTSVLLFIIFTVFFTFFLLTYRSLLFNFLIYILPSKNKNIAKDVFTDVKKMIKGYMLGLLLEMIIVSSLCSISFSLLGIHYALLLGVMAGIFNVIPYVGIFSALAISMLVTLVTSGVATKVLVVAAVVIPVHLIDSNVIVPFLVGSRVRVNAFITFLGIIAGGLIWGIPGMFLSIPMNAIAKIIFDHVENYNHWGILFGDEYAKPGERNIFRRRIKKKSTGSA